MAISAQIASLAMYYLISNKREMNNLKKIRFAGTTRTQFNGPYFLLHGETAHIPWPLSQSNEIKSHDFVGCTSLLFLDFTGKVTKRNIAVVEQTS